MENVRDDWLSSLRVRLERLCAGAGDFRYVNLGDSISTGVIGIETKGRHYAHMAAQSVAAELGVASRRGLYTPEDCDAVTFGRDQWEVTGGGLYGAGAWLLRASGTAQLEYMPDGASNGYEVGLGAGSGVRWSVDGGAMWEEATADEGATALRVPAAGGTLRLRAAGGGDARVLWVAAVGEPALTWYTSGIGATRVSDLARILGASGGEGYAAYGALRPDLLTIEIGVNDTIHADEEEPAETVAALREVLSGLRSAGVSMVALLGAGPVRADFQPGPWRVQDAYREVYRPVAREFGIPLIDWYSRWGSYEAAFAAGYLADQVHPNAAGHADVGEMIAGLLLTGA